MKITGKVNTALTNIDTSFASLLDRKKRGCPIGSFVIYDTLFSFQGPMSRCIEKAHYDLLVDSIKKSLEKYAYYIDQPTDEDLNILEISIMRSRGLIRAIRKNQGGVWS